MRKGRIGYILSAFKAIVDPKGLMNPGALGLK